MFSLYPIALSLAVATAATGSTTFCEPAETPVFSCELGRKQVSVCASGRLLTYRYGAPGKAPEMQISSDGRDGRVHSDAVVGGGGGQQTSLRFTNGNTHYIIFSGYAGSLTESPGKQWSGLDVLDGTASTSNRHCSGKTIIPLTSSAIPSFVPADEENGPFSGWR